MNKVNKVIIIMLATLILLLFCMWQNNSIVTTNITYLNGKIPTEFHGCTIVQISDLHNKKFGKNQKKILDEIDKAAPDIIAITGDLIDRRKMDIDVAVEFAREAVGIAPVYYVSGNHEAWSGKYDELRTKLLDLGVMVLDDSAMEITKNEAAIRILGLSDPDFLTSNYLEGTNTTELEENLRLLSVDESFQILLSHRPELIDIYAENNIDLVFSGHAHGGQVRLPFIGAIIAPDQGWFPKYTSGEYKMDNTTMIVSRGLGNSVFPVRVFNRPEIVVVTLDGGVAQ